MKKIDYRVWDKINKKMLYVDHSDICHCGNNDYELSPFQIQIINWQYSENPTLDNFEIMDYTGIKDKNNKKIYEGDILKGELYGKNNIEEIIYNIEFEGDGFLTSGFYFNFDTDVNHKLIAEIIGNIYESPELLK